MLLNKDIMVFIAHSSVFVKSFLKTVCIDRYNVTEPKYMSASKLGKGGIFGVVYSCSRIQDSHSDHDVYFR